MTLVPGPARGVPCLRGDLMTAPQGTKGGSVNGVGTDSQARRLRAALVAVPLLLAIVLGGCGMGGLVAPATPDPAEVEDAQGAGGQAPSGEEQVAALAMELETQRPDLFVQWGVSKPGEPGDFWFLLTAQPDPVLAARIAALPAEVVIRIAPVGAEGVAAIEAALITALAKHPETYAWSRAGAGASATEIVVEYALTPEALAAADEAKLTGYEEEALAAARDATASGELPVKVTFRRVDGAAPPLE